MLSSRIPPLDGEIHLSNLSNFPGPPQDKLGDGKERVDRLTRLIAIFENPALDFSKNRADGDDILGDAYEYLMRHFATESGKSKGQFYTPAEVSRVMAKVLGIGTAKISPNTTVTVYDPTCGSGSLLLKVGDEAKATVTLYGQEKDAATSGLASMNMILHSNPSAMIKQGNTLADPKYRDGNTLKTFDYVVANPPFSDKRWTTGLDPLNDTYGRFESFGVPPGKQGDYAYLLHIVRSLKPAGQGSCILPHGVLFRGNAEADIRRNLVRKGYIKGIIGLPANLFYGTSIPACIVVIDKRDAHVRKGVFMVNASQGFIKQGPKNRLRSQDIHKMVDVYTRQMEVPGYSRMVSHEEIEKNEFNLNLPRYIEIQRTIDRQDIEAHIKGGIPVEDIDALQSYWDVCPSLRSDLFAPNRKGYVDLAVDINDVRAVISEHLEFLAFLKEMNTLFQDWRKRSDKMLKSLTAGCNPKDVIFRLSEDLLAHYNGKPLVNKYAVYQHLMNYWIDVMQDDCYLISGEGWLAETYRIIKKTNQGKEKDRGWTCDLIPRELIISCYFPNDQIAIDRLRTEINSIKVKRAAIEDEHSGETGVFSELEKINKGNVTTHLSEINGDPGAAEETSVLNAWLALSNEEAQFQRQIKKAEAELDAKAYKKYPDLSDVEIREITVDKKWLVGVDTLIQGEMNQISQTLTQRVQVLAKRYEKRLSDLTASVASCEVKVKANLERMGFAW